MGDLDICMTDFIRFYLYDSSVTGLSYDFTESEFTIDTGVIAAGTYNPGLQLIYSALFIGDPFTFIVSSGVNWPCEILEPAPVKVTVQVQSTAVISYAFSDPNVPDTHSILITNTSPLVTYEIDETNMEIEL